MKIYIYIYIYIFTYVQEQNRQVPHKSRFKMLSTKCGLSICQYLPCLLTFKRYPAIHPNYSVSNCTILQKKDLNRSSDLVVINQTSGILDQILNATEG